MDRRRVLVALWLVLAGTLVGQVVKAENSAEPVGSPSERYPGETLVTVQAYGWFDQGNGEALIVNDSVVVWRYGPPNTQVFDAEAISDDRVLVSMAEYVPAAECPTEFADTERYSDHCVRNRVVEVSRADNTVLWEYSWYDAFIHWHEVHDTDRLPSGETVIADMGNNRVFSVARDGTVTWEWNATEALAPGSAFVEEYVPENHRSDVAPGDSEGDWTHLNDVDVLADGTVQVSIRNFDVVVTVDPATNEIVDVVGVPGNRGIMFEQHNPNRLAGGTMLVADSENDRVVELDVETGVRVWSYTGPSGDSLQWPRDADRLPNGNTLIADSRNFRVLEVNETGTVVWSYSLAKKKGIVYEVDRLGLPEEPREVPSANAAGVDDRNRVERWVATVESWAGFVFPPWVGVGELASLFGLLVVGVGLVVDVVVARLR